MELSVPSDATQTSLETDKSMTIHATMTVSNTLEAQAYFDDHASDASEATSSSEYDPPSHTASMLPSMTSYQ